MKIIKHINNLKNFVYGMNNLSFVPTMGGLHDGHISLIKKAKNRSGKVIVSIYVNPKQFNSKNDFRMYPRNLKKDLIKLKKIKVDLLYLPNYKEIFSFKVKNKIYIDKFSNELCGKFRPRHFKGVINIVNRFLEIIKPQFIYLGKKDFQQCYLIKQHIKLANIKTQVVECNTVRNKKGLAHSSRNINLNKSQLNLASNIIKLIKNEKLYLIKNNSKKINLTFLKNKLVRSGINRIEYLKAINLNTLKDETNPKKKFNIFVSFYINKIRIIDNI